MAPVPFTLAVPAPGRPAAPVYGGDILARATRLAHPSWQEGAVTRTSAIRRRPQHRKCGEDYDAQQQVGGARPRPPRPRLPPVPMHAAAAMLRGRARLWPCPTPRASAPHVSGAGRNHQWPGHAAARSLYFNDTQIADVVIIQTHRQGETDENDALEHLSMRVMGAGPWAWPRSVRFQHSRSRPTRPGTPSWRGASRRAPLRTPGGRAGSDADPPYECRRTLQGSAAAGRSSIFRAEDIGDQLTLQAHDSERFRAQSVRVSRVMSAWPGGA